MRKHPSSLLIALLLHLSLSSLTDARALTSPQAANYGMPLNEMLDGDDEFSDEEVPMGSFSQLPLEIQQQSPPLPSPSPPCAEPPFTLPSPTSNQFPPPLSGIPTQGPLSPPPAQTPAHPQPGPITQIPSPPISLPGPPTQIPSPPTPLPGPPAQIPTPPAHTPSVPIVGIASPPPPSQKKPESGTWCVAKPSVSDSLLQLALDYACGTGGDCKLIQPSGPCFQPNTVSAHSSFAFNSYWQKAKVAGGTCDFGGTAMLVSTDPSYNGCHFVFS